jgi:hypothetical protein
MSNRFAARRAGRPHTRDAVPSKRTPISRQLRHKLTLEAVALFRRGEALRPIYDRCVEGRRCKSTDAARHCPECAEYLTIHRRLNWTTLGLQPWSMSVFDTQLDRGGPAPESLRGRCIAETWDAVMGLRRALQEAVREEDGAE